MSETESAGALYALSGGKLFASTDGGRSFTARAGGLAGGRLKAAPVRDLWIAAVGGLFRSTDGGAAWVRINDDRHQFGGAIGGVITGDPEVYGRVYMGSSGPRRAVRRTVLTTGRIVSVGPALAPAGPAARSGVRRPGVRIDRPLVRCRLGGAHG